MVLTGERYSLDLTILSGEMRFELKFREASYGNCKIDFDGEGTIGGELIL